MTVTGVKRELISISSVVTNTQDTLDMRLDEKLPHNTMHYIKDKIFKDLGTKNQLADLEKRVSSMEAKLDVVIRGQANQAAVLQKFLETMPTT